MTIKIDSIKTILDNKVFFQDTVNSCKTKIETDSETVTVTRSSFIDKKEFERIESALSGLKYRPEAIAQTLSEKLNDQDSFEYYLILAKNSPQDKLLEALSFVDDADHRGVIRTKKAIYFISILRKWGIKTNFKS